MRRRPARGLALLLLAAPVLANALGCEPVAQDDALLRSLSRDELMGLCDELRDATPAPDEPVRCEDGWSATIVAPGNAACGDLASGLDGCEATAGDVRACAEAVRRDPCSAIDSEPPECAPLYASACVPAFTASVVTAGCPRAEPQALSELEGVYELVSHTLRSGSCEAGGDSVLELDVDRFVVVVATENFFGDPVGLLESCASIESCREAAAPLRDSTRQGIGDLGAPEPELEASFVCIEPDRSALSGSLIQVPAPEDECRLIQIENFVARAADGTLRLQAETWESREPLAPAGCNFTSGDRRTAAGECTSLEVHEARFVAAL